MTGCNDCILAIYISEGVGIYTQGNTLCQLCNRYHQRLCKGLFLGEDVTETDAKIERKLEEEFIKWFEK